MNKNDKHRSLCSISCSLELIGDKWTLIIVRDLLFFGKTTFKEFLECEENIATNILDDRLKKLVSEGILDYTGTEKRKKYFLTQKGKDLEPILIQMHNLV
jgi:DNA-binding HxlR family transcriptional regulator